MEVIGYTCALLIGISLGLIGGGGSILTVPVLVYLFGIPPTLSISYSLFIVGLTSLAGAFNSYRRSLVSVKTALTFGTASVSTVFIIRRFVIPHVPEVFFRVGNFQVTHGFFVMVVFAVLMLSASVSMIKDAGIPSTVLTPANKKLLSLLLYGILAGLVTGFLGAGGGFLLVPALVLIMKLPIKQAIGTSLLIISLNSIVGFCGDLGRHAIHWHFLLGVTAISIAGVYLGGLLNRRVDGQRLKKGFGYFVLLMGALVLATEIYDAMH